MGKDTDDAICAMKRIACRIAGDDLGISPMAVRYGISPSIM